MNRSITEILKIPESIRIPYFGGKIYSYLTKKDNESILKEQIPQNPLNTEKRDEIIIVSLTSYPARIEYVHLAIKSLMLQTVKPDRILLWLAEEQFPDKILPQNLIDLQKFGLEICWTNDIYGHKKYFYPVKEQKANEVVITYDDDLIYSERSIERLIKTHKKYPKCLVCERGQTINEKYLNNPGRWKTISSLGVTKPTYSMNPSPGGGCLIPYKAFFEDAGKEDVIRELAYKNDDLWYMFMCAQNGTRMIKTRKFHKTFTAIEGSQVEQMATENIGNNYNAVVLEKLKKAYPVAWERIYTDKD